MESRVKNDFEIRTIHATLHDMRTFQKFVERLEVECAAECAVKIIPPAGYETNSVSLKPATKLSNVVSQESTRLKIREGTAYELSFERERKMSYKRFKELVLKNEEPGKSIEQYEDQAWRQLQENNGKSIYAIDNALSLFNKKCNLMNLNRFTRAESIIHQGNDWLMGIHKPFLYVGSHITYFGFHLEDADLSSINYLHQGASKVWYIVPTSEHTKLEQLAQKFVKSVGTTCSKFIRHKALMISPATLKRNKIRFSRVVQNPNEFIISFSGGYHSGFNCGINKAEAINFATQKWLKCFLQFTPCDCTTEHSNGIRGVGEALRGIHKNETLKFIKKTAYTCDLCGKNFSSKGNIRRHMIEMHSAWRNKYQCTICNRMFTRKSNVDIHTRDFHNEKRIPTKVLVRAGKGSKAPSKRHIGYVACEICEQVMLGESLKRHIKNKHNNPHPE